MTDIEKLLKNDPENGREKFFVSEAKRMWNIRDNGIKNSLPINWDALRKEGMLNKHLKKIEKYFTKNGKFVNNVTYYYILKDGKLEIFLEESDGGFDWKQNFMAFGFKVKIGFDYRRYHLGFYATALTVFEDLVEKNLLIPDTIVEIFGYSHGAGAAPSLYSLIHYNTLCHMIESVKKFEPPCDIYMPNKNVKKECENHFNFIQGQDIVTKVPWWMKSLGVKINIKGRPLSLLKGFLRVAFDHDIYWTDPKHK